MDVARSAVAFVAAGYGLALGSEPLQKIPAPRADAVAHFDPLTFQSLGANMKRCLRFFASDGYEQSLRAIEGFENTLLRVNGQF